MYKVFINNKPLILTSGKPVDFFSGPKNKIIEFSGIHQIEEAIDILYSETATEEVTLFSENEKKLWEIFCSNFIVLEAAGGMVFNERNELLMICRFEKWDLPKGKIEKGESPSSAAKREVCEETGVCDLEIISEDHATYHTYVHKRKHILKKTFWFKMKCKNFSSFKLQDEEGIKDAQWMNKEQLKEAMKNTYPSIAELLKDSQRF